MVAPQPFFRARGTPFSVLHRIRALASAGHLVTLVTYPFGDDIELPGLTIVRCGTPPLVRDIGIGPSIAKLPLDFLLYRETVRQLKSGTFDVIHSHEEAAFFAAPLAKRFGLRHIYAMHSSLPQQLQNFRRYNIAPIRWLFERLERYVLDTCDAVITICPELGEVIERLCPDKLHEMIENTGDDAKVFPPPQPSAASEQARSGQRVILYTGTFELYQGLPLLLSAFEQIAVSYPDAHLMMVGGNARQVNEARAQVAAMGLAERTTLVGTVHPSMIPSYLEAASLIVSPRSSGTNTPLKIYGYLRSGVPLVATDILSHTQTLSPEVACLVPATSEGLQSGIRRLLDDSEFALAWSERAMRQAEEKYSDREYLRKVNEIYQLMFPELSLPS